MNVAPDQVLRVMTSDGGFRVVSLRAEATVAGVVGAQGVAGPDAVLLAELVMAAVLIRETMAPGLRVQVILQGAGGRTMVADSHPGGATRALFSTVGEPFELGSEPLLQVIRTMPGAQLHQSVVGFAADEGLSGALMIYMQDSEQIVSFAAVSCRLGGGGDVAAAGGYLVQLLPEAKRAELERVTERLTAMPPLAELLEAGAGPGALTRALFDGIAFDELERGPLSFGCRCSQDRMLLALTTLGREEIGKMVDAKTRLDVTCDYCGTSYPIEPEQLLSLLQLAADPE